MRKKHVAINFTECFSTPLFFVANVTVQLRFRYLSACADERSARIAKDVISLLTEYQIDMVSKGKNILC